MIGQSVLEPVARALSAIRGVSRGDLSVRTGHHGRDEVGQMLKATDEMVHMLERFSQETHVMIRLHEADDISHRMPEDFPGVYGELAGGINTMMFEHLDAFRDAIGILERYANGDLSQDARRLPGTRAFLHEAMDAAKQSLLAINAEIKRLAQAAAARRFQRPRRRGALPARLPPDGAGPERDDGDQRPQPGRSCPRCCVRSPMAT